MSIHIIGQFVPIKTSCSVSKNIYRLIIRRHEITNSCCDKIIRDYGYKCSDIDRTSGIRKINGKWHMKIVQYGCYWCSIEKKWNIFKFKLISNSLNWKLISIYPTSFFYTKPITTKLAFSYVISHFSFLSHLFYLYPNIYIHNRWLSYQNKTANFLRPLNREKYNSVSIHYSICYSILDIFSIQNQTFTPIHDVLQIWIFC